MTVVVRATGLSKLRRDLKAIDRDLGRRATAHIRGVASQVRDTARERAPYLLGELRRSIKHSVRAKGASVYSNLPQAPVIEFGGTIEPRGVVIKFEPSEMIYGAIEARAADVEEQLGDLLDVIADQHGFT